jgi:hypothetical protein
MNEATTTLTRAGCQAIRTRRKFTKAQASSS